MVILMGMDGLQWQLGYDPSEELFGLGVNLKPRFIHNTIPYFKFAILHVFCVHSLRVSYL